MKMNIYEIKVLEGFLYSVGMSLNPLSFVVMYMLDNVILHQEKMTFVTIRRNQLKYNLTYSSPNSYSEENSGKDHKVR